MINNFKTPILFIVFNRPDTTKRVFEAIRQSKPEKLFIAADGPRKNEMYEIEKCKEVRDIVKQIDWQCEVKTLFQEKNLGCKIGVSTAINWFFQNVNEGIILEDDCLPNKSFFLFTSKMLEKYRNNEAIMHINGSNFQFGIKRGSASYYFSNFIHVWGWGTWKRAWEKYDINTNGLEEYTKSNKIYKLFKNKKIAKFWISLINHVLKYNIDTWDAQWVYTILKSEGIAITPNINLVENIGFGKDATHTKENSDKSMQKNYNIGIIIEPLDIVIDQDADEYTFKKMYQKPLYSRVISKIKQILKI